MVEGKSRVEAERREAARMKAMDAARVRVRTGSWQAWLNIAVAAAAIGLPLYQGRVVWLILVLPVAGILTVFAAWRWLSDAEVSFDADGVRVTDRYWQLLRRQPIFFGYSEGIQIVVRSGPSYLVARVNGLRIATGKGAAARLETAARNMGLSFTRLDTSIETAAPTVLIWASIAALFLVHGLLGLALYYVLYGSGLLTVIIPFLDGHREWEVIAARRGSR